MHVYHNIYHYYYYYYYYYISTSVISIRNSKVIGLVLFWHAIVTVELACASEYALQWLLTHWCWTNHCSYLQISWRGFNISTFFWKPVRLKCTVMPFTNIVQSTANHSHVQHTPTTHNLPPSFQPAKCLLHHPPCADQAIIEAAHVGRLSKLVALDTGGLKRKGWISHNKASHSLLQ